MQEEKRLLMKGHMTIESPCYVLLLQQCLQRCLQCVSLTCCTACDSCEFPGAVLLCRALSHSEFLDCEYTSSSLPASTKIAFPLLGQTCTLFNLPPCIRPDRTFLCLSVCAKRSHGTCSCYDVAVSISAVDAKGLCWNYFL